MGNTTTYANQDRFMQGLSTAGQYLQNYANRKQQSNEAEKQRAWQEKVYEQQQKDYFARQAMEAAILGKGSVNQTIAGDLKDSSGQFNPAIGGKLDLYGRAQDVATGEQSMAAHEDVMPNNYETYGKLRNGEASYRAYPAFAKEDALTAMQKEEIRIKDADLKRKIERDRIAAQKGSKSGGLSDEDKFEVTQNNGEIREWNKIINNRRATAEDKANARYQKKKLIARNVEIGYRTNTQEDPNDIPKVAYSGEPQNFSGNTVANSPFAGLGNFAPQQAQPAQVQAGQAYKEKADAMAWVQTNPNSPKVASIRNHYGF